MKLYETLNKVTLSEDLEVSPIIHGQWRLSEWGLTNNELLSLLNECVNLGVTTFDHADIYGDYSCEALFGAALKLQPELRDKIQLISKCGIKLISEKYPERTIKHYDYSYKHIVSSAENSLKQLHTDRLDLLLLHRPAPFFDPDEVSKAFNHLKNSGKVLHFGVSNFTPQEFSMLNSRLEDKLVTNQIEISPYCLEHFENNNINYLIENNIKPMAWSPLAGGEILKPKSDKGKRVLTAIQEVANDLQQDKLDKVIYSWLLKHPAKILPIVGTGNINRIKTAVDASQLPFTLEHWYKIYSASMGVEVP
ncbi:aldo/keto reductase family oxidoreductase [Gillisia sp. Hel_I_29]|uniref:aldo/keto reductase n=1 Tax=Gillisia sp. Hel_I_29 TaxID=1249975 RepID=UPI00054CEC5B|nr:aldo/keto reductase [Gillisia sp. Hel_I_29]